MQQMKQRKRFPLSWGKKNQNYPSNFYGVQSCSQTWNLLAAAKDFLLFPQYRYWNSLFHTLHLSLLIYVHQALSVGIKTEPTANEALQGECPQDFPSGWALEEKQHKLDNHSSESISEHTSTSANPSIPCSSAQRWGWVFPNPDMILCSLLSRKPSNPSVLSGEGETLPCKDSLLKFQASSFLANWKAPWVMLL